MRQFFILPASVECLMARGPSFSFCSFVSRTFSNDIPESGTHVVLYLGRRQIVPFKKECFQYLVECTGPTNLINNYCYTVCFFSSKRNSSKRLNTQINQLNINYITLVISFKISSTHLPTDSDIFNNPSRLL